MSLLAVAVSPFVDSDDEENQENDLSSTLVGSGDYDIVGIRYYSGVAHPGEFVQLVREPSNPYDRNAIRVDNMHGEKIGHIKATMAKLLSPIMDNAQFGIRTEGTIPRKGNAYTLPIHLEFYCTNHSSDSARRMLQKALKRDYSFRLSSEFNGSASSSAKAVSPTVSVVRKKLDWNSQQADLDKMFDKQLEEQYNNLPKLSMPSCFTGITLLDYQVQGIKWLVKKEINASPAPFYKKVKENKQQMYLCEITNSSQSHPPAPIRGSILCDEMGLGKSIQTIGLILLAPPPGVEYKPSAFAVADNTLKVTDEKMSAKSNVPIPKVVVGPTKRCTLIVCPVSVLSNWTSQTEQYVLPGVLSMHLYHGANRHDIIPSVKAGLVDVLLVSYHTLAADYGAAIGNEAGNNDLKPKAKKTKRESIFDVNFHRIVLDEAHTIRNSVTNVFKAVKEVKADRKLALTGTPFVNRADDIYGLLSFIGVEPLNDKSVFTRAITQPIKNGDELGLSRLRACMGYVCLRRSKGTVGLKLVPKEVQLISVEFPNNAHKKLYDALYGTLKVCMSAILGQGADNQALKNYSFIFEKLLRLRQACCSGTLVSKERRDVALKVWDEMNSKSTAKLSAEEALSLLEKLKGAFTEESNSLPECGICLMEMEEVDGCILKNCSHVFCKVCIQQVLSKSNKKCPYCRADFEVGDIVDMSTAENAVSTTKEVDTDDATAKFGTPPKILALLDAIKGLAIDEKGVIFSQFTKHLDLIGEAMTEAGHSFVRIDGSVSAQKRIVCISQFNADGPDTPRFILCSLLASGTGINLTRGNYAFMMDLWWNEAVENQAMDRIHRINQTRKVTVMRFVMKDSIEERIVQLQQKKGMQAKGVLSKLKGDEKRKALLGDVRGLLEIDEK